MKMKTFETNGDFKDNYKMIIGGIVPRPIAVVSTLNENGTNNVAPFSFFTAVCSKPLILGFSPQIRASDGKKKDTLLNIERDKTFVINIFSLELAEKINMTATELSHGEDESELAGLNMIDSEAVNARRIEACPIQYECKLRDVLSYGDQPGNGAFVTGEVVRVHIREDLLDNGRINTDLLNPVGRGAGNDWVKCTERFQLERKQKAQIQ